MAILEKFFFGCGHCHGVESCPMSESALKASDSPFGHGGMLVVSCLLVFVMPLGSALLGGHFSTKLFPADASMSVTVTQGLGMLCGLIVGVLIAKVAIAILRRYARTSEKLN